MCAEKDSIKLIILLFSYHLSPSGLHHVFAPIRGYYYGMRWLYGTNYDPFESNTKEGVHPLIVWMKYHQAKIRNIYISLVYIFPIVLSVIILFELCFKSVKSLAVYFFFACSITIIFKPLV